MFYSDEIIDEVREKNDIVDVISSYIKITKRGGNHIGICPFHNEKTPSFMVSSQKQIFKCFGCGAGGNVYGFVMKYENLTFVEALQELAARAGVNLPTANEDVQKQKERNEKEVLYEINKLAATFYYYKLQNSDNIGLQYLIKRGLTMAVIRRFGLGFADKSADTLYKFLKSKGYDDLTLKHSGLFKITESYTMDKFWNRVMFPILDRNSKVIGFGGRVMGDGAPKYLNSPDTLLFDKSRTLYGLNLAKNTKEESMILCEGYMDVIAMHQAGFTNAVAALGTAFTPTHANILKRYTKQAILCFDSDEAGIKATRRAIPILREHGIRVRILNLMPYKDPDDFIKNLGEAAFSERISSAKNAFLWDMEILRRDFDFSDPEQKTMYLHKLAEELAKFDDAIERENYMRAMAKEYSVDYKDFRNLVYHIGNQAYIQKEIKEAREEDRAVLVRRRDKQNGLQKSQSILLTLCMEDATIFHAVKEVLKPTDFVGESYIAAADMLYKEYETGMPNLSRLLGKYTEDEDKQAMLLEMFDSKYRAEIEDADRKKVVEEILSKMMQHILDVRKQTASANLDMAGLQKVSKEINELRQHGIRLSW